MVLDVLSQLFDTLTSQIINIPIEGTLSIVYVVFNLVASVFLLLMGYDSTGGSGGLF